MKASILSPAKKSDGYHKYLKPGQLARLRDLRISARSHKASDELTQLLVNSIRESARRVSQSFDEVPCFMSGKIYGPQSMGRKKLVAVNSMFLFGDNGSEGSGDAGSNDSFVNSSVNSNVLVH